MRGIGDIDTPYAVDTGRAMMTGATRQGSFVHSITGLTQSAIQPSAERYFIFFGVSFFSLAERKNETQIKREAPCCRRRKGVYSRRRVTQVNYTSRPSGTGRIAIDSHPSQHYHYARLPEAPSLEHT
jgi:hypothetical protein